MNRECFDYARECSRRGGLWKLAAAVLFAAFLAMTVTAFMLKIKNNSYRDMLIKVSEKFPATPEQEEEMAEIRKREWSRAHAPANRKTDEERIAENRITEED